MHLDNERRKWKIVVTLSLLMNLRTFYETEPKLLLFK